MKMTMHIDERLLDRVIRKHGFASKTEAVAEALKEMDRKARYANAIRRGLTATPEEMKAAVDPDYDIHALRVAKASATYGSKYARPRSR